MKIKSSYKAKIELPYNPDDVNIRLQHFRVFELVKMIESKTLDILDDEDFEMMDSKNELQSLFSATSATDELDIWGEDDVQRNIGLWNNQQKSLFIESLMIKLPIPLFYFDGSSRPWRVIDGLQRLHTIMSFIQGKFKLVGMEYLIKDSDKKSFKELPGYLKARILEAEVESYVINPGTPSDVKFNIFKRINTGGLKLTGQEIRNSFFRGEPSFFTKQLALEPSFKKVTNYNVPSRRMLDREYATRFIAFQIFDFSEYNSKMDLFLSYAMFELYNFKQKDFNELRHTFITSMERCYDLFGVHAFYRPKKDGDWGRSPNKALFDTLSWNISKLSESNFNSILRVKNEFINDYIIFMNEDEKIFNAINDTTGTRKAVVNRFVLMNGFLKKYIK